MNVYLIIFNNCFLFFELNKKLKFETTQDFYEFLIFKIFKKYIFLKISSKLDSFVNFYFQILKFKIKKFFNRNLFKKKINLIFNFNLFLLNIFFNFKFLNFRYSILYRIYFYNFNFKNLIKIFYFKKFDINFLIFILKYFIGTLDFYYLSENIFIIDFKRIIYEINLIKIKKNFFFFIKGNSFLYKMIRNLISFIFFFININYNLEYFLDFFFYKNLIFNNISFLSSGLFLIYIKLNVKI